MPFPQSAAPTFQELHGKYYTQTKSGQMFVGSTAAAGVVAPIYSSVNQTFGLWNPLGSNVNLIMVNLRIATITVGVIAAAAFVWGVTQNAGSQVGTGAPIASGTFVAPTNMLITGQGQGGVSKAFFAPATIVTTVGPLLLMATGIGVINATAMDNAFVLGEDYDGTFIVGPGAAVYLSNNVAGVQTYVYSIKWYEAPV